MIYPESLLIKKAPATLCITKYFSNFRSSKDDANHTTEDHWQSSTAQPYKHSAASNLLDMPWNLSFGSQNSWWSYCLLARHRRSCVRHIALQNLEIATASCAMRREGYARRSVWLANFVSRRFCGKICFVGYLTWIRFVFKLDIF
jgi:hypothetical protein